MKSKGERLILLSLINLFPIINGQILSADLFKVIDNLKIPADYNTLISSNDGK